MIPEEVVVCVRAEKKMIVEGSTREKCCNCNHNVWVSPATRTSIEQGLYPNAFACCECIIKVKE